MLPFDLYSSPVFVLSIFPNINFFSAPRGLYIHVHEFGTL